MVLTWAILSVPIVYILYLQYTVKNVNEWSPSPARNYEMLLIKLFVVEYSAFGEGGGGGGFSDQERKTPGNSKIPEVFPARKS